MVCGLWHKGQSRLYPLSWGSGRGNPGSSGQSPDSFAGNPGIPVAFEALCKSLLTKWPASRNCYAQAFPTPILGRDQIGNPALSYIFKWKLGYRNYVVVIVQNILSKILKKLETCMVSRQGPVVFTAAVEHSGAAYWYFHFLSVQEPFWQCLNKIRWIEWIRCIRIIWSIYAHVICACLIKPEVPGW